MKKTTNEFPEDRPVIRPGEDPRPLYAFLARNAHLDADTAIRLYMDRPDAGVCRTIREWNALGYSVEKNSKGIPVLDMEGVRWHYFEDKSVRGGIPPRVPGPSVSELVPELEELNGLGAEGSSSFDRLLSAVSRYLDQNWHFERDERRDRALAEGAAFLLYVSAPDGGTDTPPISHVFPEDVTGAAEEAVRVRVAASALRRETLRLRRKKRREESERRAAERAAARAEERAARAPKTGESSRTPAISVLAENAPDETLAEAPAETGTDVPEGTFIDPPEESVREAPEIIPEREPVPKREPFSGGLIALEEEEMELFTGEPAAPALSAEPISAPGEASPGVLSPERYRAIVSERVEREYAAFRKKMLDTDPEYVFYRNYEIHVKTELADVIKEKDCLRPEYYAALYAEGEDLLELLYDDFLSDEVASVNTYPQTVAFIEGYCEKFHGKTLRAALPAERPVKEESGKMETTVSTAVPVYGKAWEVADRAGELERWRASLAADRECRDALDKALADFPDGIPPETERSLSEKYGEARVECVLANTVRNRAEDARFSREVRRWAADTNVYADVSGRLELVLGSHPLLINALVERRIKRAAESGAPAPEIRPYKSVVGRDAAVMRYEQHSMFRMPVEDKKYGGFVYYLENGAISPGLRLADEKKGIYEPVYELSLDPARIITLRNGPERAEITSKELFQRTDGSLNHEYARKIPDPSDTHAYLVRVPRVAFRGRKENNSVFAMPDSAEFPGTYRIPSREVDFHRQYADGVAVLRAAENVPVIVRTPDGKKVRLSAKAFSAICDGSAPSDYTRRPARDPYVEVEVPERARIAVYGKRSMFKGPPDSPLEGFTYYLANSLIKSLPDGRLLLSVGRNFTMELKNNRRGEAMNLSGEEFAERISSAYGESLKGGSSPEDAPRPPAGLFDAAAREALENLPEELRSRPNWVFVRFSSDPGTGKRLENPVNPFTLGPSRSGDAAGHADFDVACDAALSHDGDAVAFALHPSEGLGCVILPDCVLPDGSYTPLAEDMLNACDTYCERSPLKKGLRFFFRTQDCVTKSYSKTGDMYFRRLDAIVPVTGDAVKKTGLAVLEGPALDIVRERCGTRPDVSKIGQGPEHLSRMADRDLVESASRGRYGSSFRNLYGSGRDPSVKDPVRGLMSRLAYWTGGDVDRMLRVFATSVLRNPLRMLEFYEDAAMEAAYRRKERPESGKGGRDQEKSGRGKEA